MKMSTDKETQEHIKSKSILHATNLFMQELLREEVKNKEDMVGAYNKALCDSSKQIDSENFIHQLENEGVKIDYDYNARKLLNPSLVDFLDFNLQRNYGHSFEVRLHEPMLDKQGLVAKTLVLADPAGRNNYLLFLDLNKRITKSVFRKITWKMDRYKAAQIAEKSLENEVRPGSIGPTFLRPKDQLYVDTESIEYQRMHSHLKANFSGGHRSASIIMNFNDFVETAEHYYDVGQIHACYLYDTPKFNEFWEKVPGKKYRDEINQDTVNILSQAILLKRFK